MSSDQPLETLLRALRTSGAMRQKSEIQVVADVLAEAYQHTGYSNGDDTAVIDTGDGYDLFAAEGFIPDFVEHDPWFAGWCGLMVNISDIAAMGGRPVAVVNTLWGQNDQCSRDILAGMKCASHAFRVPIVGGHTNLQAGKPHLGVAILGRASALLRSGDAAAGQTLVAAIDLRGEYRAPFLNWNAATSAPPERLRGDLALLPYIAENRLAFACKDISQAGLLGTCAMMMESAGTGARIRLESVPKPEVIEWHDWLKSFPSYGYLLTTDNTSLKPLIDCFERRGIAASAIGEVTDSGDIQVERDGERARFWDFRDHRLTGFNGATCPGAAIDNRPDNCQRQSPTKKGFPHAGNVFSDSVA